MSKKMKIILAIAVVFVLLLLINPSFHWVREGISTSASTGSSVCGDPNPSFCKRIAIVAPADNAGNAHLQDAVVKQLKKRLESEAFLPSNYKQENNGSSWTNDRPTVCTHATVNEAIKHGADFVIIIKAPKWEYSLFPFSRTWKAAINWKGKPPAQCVKEVVTGGEAAIMVDGELEIQGQTSGLFTTAYITQKAADTAAENITKWLKEEVEDLREKWAEKNRKT